MRLLLQRVLEAEVRSEGKLLAEMGVGLLAFVGFGKDDDDDLLEWAIQKTLNLRLFAGDEQNMNRSLVEVGAELMLVSQFTLYANPAKGRRPSYAEAAPVELARSMYNRFVRRAREVYSKIVTGAFQASMQVSLVNDGPVTIWLAKDSSA